MVESSIFQPWGMKAPKITDRAASVRAAMGRDPTEAGR
jgi:hypothetical protein